MLSRSALELLQNSVGSNELCNYSPWSPFEDVNMGACLHSLGKVIHVSLQLFTFVTNYRKMNFS